jgi:hypothetical protein
MTRVKRVVLLLELADKLRAKGSWCGETHIQKATYLAQELVQLPTDFEFILYKHGPFSFELRDEITAMRADELLEMKTRREPYGPSLVPTSDSTQFRKRFPLTVAKHAHELDFVAGQVGDRSVSELERLATALFVMREDDSRDRDEQAGRIHELKPHVTVPEALRALQEVERIAAEANRRWFGSTEAEPDHS